jgi:hypothetical protein
MPDLQLNTSGTFTGASSSGGSGILSYFSSGGGTSSPFSAILEYQSSSGAWIPYSYSTGINDATDTWLLSTFQNSGKLSLQGSSGNWTIKAPLTPLAGTANTAGPSLGIDPLFMTSDPRSLRFGQWQFDRGDSGTAASYATTAGEDSRLWRTSMPVLTGTPNPDNAWQASGYGGDHANIGDVQLAPNSLDPSGNGFYYPAQLARNNTANTAPNSSYVDNDGVQRMGDSGLYPSTQNFNAGNPFAGNAVRPQDRPVILNRPFQSVTELGYTLRDDPWRSLDFFSPVSADAALLDFFCVNEAASGMVAGRINLNSQNTPALQAVLNNTISDAMGSPPATMGNPAAMAQALAAYTAATPLVNKSDLSKFVGSALPSADFASSTFGDEQNIKAQREATVRALADVGQTRTWNLMIDIVAQAGRYPPTAQTLDQFVVEGERRYWLHVAIDRFTGKVIDQKLEPVTE